MGTPFRRQAGTACVGEPAVPLNGRAARPDQGSEGRSACPNPPRKRDHRQRRGSPQLFPHLELSSPQGPCRRRAERALTSRRDVRRLVGRSEGAKGHRPARQRPFPFMGRDGPSEPPHAPRGVLARDETAQRAVLAQGGAGGRGSGRRPMAGAEGAVLAEEASIVSITRPSPVFCRCSRSFCLSHKRRPDPSSFNVPRSCRRDQPRNRSAKKKAAPQGAASSCTKREWV
jgi:hypothetical protein